MDICKLCILASIALTNALDDDAVVYVNDLGGIELKATSGGDIKLLPGSGGAVHVDNTRLITDGLRIVNFTDIAHNLHDLWKTDNLLQTDNKRLSTNLNSSMQALQQRVRVLENENKQLRTANEQLRQNLTAVSSVTQNLNQQATRAPIGSLQNPAQSCQHLLNVDKHTPSGEHWIRPLGSDKMQVYCEMDVHGGGFTFVSTRAVTASATSSSINQLMTNKSSVLFRFVTDKFEQYYSIVEQLDKFKNKPLSVAQNSDAGYTQPLNKGTIGASGYLFVGILDAVTARVKGALQGYKSNGIPINFTNCDANPNSYIALFPNHDELSPRSYHPRNDFFDRWRNTFTAIPAGLEMPRKYFFFTEMHFGGCGIYSSSDSWNFVTASAVGVR